jgi:hypothetical protein
VVKSKKVIKNKTSIKKGLYNFFHSYHVILVTLIIIITFLICFSFHLMNSSKTYMFSGSSKYISIYNGVIATNYNIDLFEGSDINYIYKSDYIVTKYKFGYYLKINNKYKKLTSISGNDSKGLSLKGLLEEYCIFNITEPSHNKKYFSNVNIQNMTKNLYFIMEVTTTNKNSPTIKDYIKIDVSKLSR